MSSLHATATSSSIRHFWVRAWRRCASQERRPARPDLLEGGKGLVPLRVALSPLQQQVVSPHCMMRHLPFPPAIRFLDFSPVVARSITNTGIGDDTVPTESAALLDTTGHRQLTYMRCKRREQPTPIRTQNSLIHPHERSTCATGRRDQIPNDVPTDRNRRKSKESQ
jgi:hypothetical protein